MTQPEFIEFLNRARLVLQPVNELIAKGSTADQPGARDERLALWLRVLSDVDRADAERCLDQVETDGPGVLADDPQRVSKHPDAWTDFARYVRRWTRNNRPVVLRFTPQGGDDNEPRYRCEACFDSQVVSAILPEYLELQHVREHWDGWQVRQLQNPLTARCREYLDQCRKAYREAAAGCRARRELLTAGVLCTCAGERSWRWRQWNPTRMARINKGGATGFAEACVRFYETHPLEVTNAWQP